MTNLIEYFCLEYAFPWGYKIFKAQMVLRNLFPDPMYTLS